MREYDAVIVGGGAAGMSCACTLMALRRELRVLLIDSAAAPGGVLNQCTHTGFGSGYLGRDMSGTEYARVLSKRLGNSGAELSLSTEALELGEDKTLLLSSPRGLEKVSFRALVLSTGCRERAIGSMDTAGSRPSGVFAAGEAQRLINLGGYDLGDTAVILGSGDMGLIMARLLRQKGKRVALIVEREESCTAMERNIRQCLEEYSLPLMCSATVETLHGGDRLRGLTVQSLKTGAREYIPCDLLLVAAGLIPERALLRGRFERERPPWLFLCGNCDRVYPIADAVSLSAESTAARVINELDKQP